MCSFKYIGHIAATDSALSAIKIHELLPKFWLSLPLNYRSELPDSVICYFQKYPRGFPFLSKKAFLFLFECSCPLR